MTHWVRRDDACAVKGRRFWCYRNIVIRRCRSPNRDESKTEMNNRAFHQALAGDTYVDLLPSHIIWRFGLRISLLNHRKLSCLDLKMQWALLPFRYSSGRGWRRQRGRRVIGRMLCLLYHLVSSIILVASFSTTLRRWSLELSSIRVRSTVTDYSRNLMAR